MEAKRTPKPWRVTRTPYCITVESDSAILSEQYLADEFHPDNAEDERVALANAQLIAAAPYLLEALQSLILFTKPTKSNAVALNHAHQVVALATLDTNL